MRIVIVLVLLVAFAIGFLYFAIFTESEPTEQTLADAEMALVAGDLEKAEELIVKYLKKFPDSYRGNLVAGDTFLKFSEVDKALPHYEAALVEENPKLMETTFVCGRLSMSLGRVADGEMYLRRVLDVEPNHIQANRGMFQILRTQARTAEMAPQFMSTIRLAFANPEIFDIKQLLVMASPFSTHLTSEDAEFVENCIKNYDEDPLPLLGRARNMLNNTDVIDSIPLLKQICEKHPQILTAHGYLGRALSRHGNSEQAIEWNAQLPENANENSDIWLSRGRFCERSGKKKAAARCYWEGLKRQSIHAECANALGRLLVEMPDYKEAGLKFQRHAFELHDLINEAMNAGPLAPGKMKTVMERMRDSGRLWEAAGWCFAAGAIPSEQAWATIELQKLLPRLEAEPAFILSKTNPANDIDLSDWELPPAEEYLKLEEISAEAPTELQMVSFREEARMKGIEFRFNNSISDYSRMFEFNGGGASILDFDLDGWPDIYFTQGAKWPVNPAQNSFLDTIYRNVGGRKFEDVGELAIEGDPNFSQGAAIGDFDNDGFPDIFVGNIGPNTFFRNNGDGTFSEVKLPESIAGDDWTIGTMIADLDSDGLPDVYALNYLAGDDLFSRSSQVTETQSVQAPAAVFDPAPDQVLANDGSWGFKSAADTPDIAQVNGKSMGLVLFRDGSGQPNLYIANDGTPNSLVRLTADPTDEALERGVAFGEVGRADVGKGIAAGDANGDGLIDLLVTNFTMEHNNMFLQDEAGRFRDKASDCGVREISYYEMGWGAQFLDGDLDGNLDLLIANGKLQDIPGAKSAQLSQYVHNIGGGRYLKAAGKVGRFFNETKFGRAVARVDWNRDGLADAVVTHRGSPHSLLTNRTEKHGDSVRLTLVGTTSPRDGVGSVVRLTTDARTLTRQVTAGDGFQCSNQKQIVFGLNPDETIKGLSVTWASGEKTDLESAPRNVDGVLVEGDDTVMEVAK